MKSLTITLGLVLALLVAASTPAHAITMTEYDVTIEGEAAYARFDAWPEPPLGQWENRSEATFKWKTRFPSVTFIGKEVGVTAEPVTLLTEVDASMHATFPTADGPKTGLCTGDRGAASPSWLGAGAIPSPDPDVESLDVRVLGGAMFQLPTCSGVFTPGPQAFGIDGTGAEIPFGAFDEPFQMPHEAIGMGKIIQLLESSVTGSRCPGYADGTVSCSLSWKATVTFLRTAQRELGPGSGDDGLDESDIPMPPQPQPNPELDESDIPDPPSPLDDLVIPMPPKRAKLSAGAERAKIALTCPVACSGSALAYPAQRGAGAAARRPLARARFKGAARRTTTVVLRFRPAARRAIRRSGGVRIELRVSPRAGGRPVRRSVVLRLSRARR